MDLFDLRLDPSVSRLSRATITYADGSSRPLPTELTHLNTLTADWQTQDRLLRHGFTTWQLARLFERGIVEFGRGAYVFPRRARVYFERQFPDRVRFKPLESWLASPVPSVIWIGLPHANLVDLRHSTATGLAATIDAMSPSASILGIVPEIQPTHRCAVDMESMAGLARECGFRLGIIGGDHRATWSLLSVLKRACGAPRVRYVHIDAHHDLYGIEQRNGRRRVNHSNFLVDLLEQHHVDQVRLFGCRDRAAPIRIAREAGYDVAMILSPNELTAEDNSKCVHTHLSIDIDVLDPARFRSVSSPLDNGLTLFELLETVEGITLSTRVDSVSIVEAGNGCAETTRAVSQLVRLLEGAL
ncbi:arginase family protein [Caballeronia sp. ATUFL_M1_KS5A]|uniref:arginase family protein n=1 Tax=Caballeronia sp. ATUFL_M1_KS5A TaxID=2921778 RepID=UPI0020288AFA